MGKEIGTQAQETQTVPNRINPRRNPKTHINQTNEDKTQKANIKSSIDHYETILIFSAEVTI